MIRPKICFAALAIVQDVNTNLISVFNIFEAIGASGFPLLLQSASFFALWERDPDDAAHVPAIFTVGLVGQPPLGTQQIVLNFEGVRNHRTIAVLNGLVVPAPGSLRFRIVPEQGTPAEYTVEITAAPPQVQIAAQAHAPEPHH